MKASILNSENTSMQEVLNEEERHRGWDKNTVEGKNVEVYREQAARHRGGHEAEGENHILKKKISGYI